MSEQDPDAQVLALSMAQPAHAFSSQLFREVVSPVMHAFCQAQRDSRAAEVETLSVLLGCVCGAIAAAAGKHTAIAMVAGCIPALRALDDSTPEPAAPDGSKTH
jgi:hypothetical protein